MKMTRWFRRLGTHTLGILLVVGGSFIVMGATGVTKELLKRPMHCQRIVQVWQDWSLTLMTGVPQGSGEDWRLVSEKCPLLIVQACMVTTAERLR